jgi:PadR family transcriptional regulator, regulatory protein PadR
MNSCEIPLHFIPSLSSITGMESINGDKLRGHLETMVLSTLEQGEAHGLEILHRLEQAGCGLLRLKEGSLYPALYRLEAAGEIKAAWESEPHGRRGARRRFYHLTTKGRRKLRAGRAEWQQFVRILGGILGAPA